MCLTYTDIYLVCLSMLISERRLFSSRPFKALYDFIAVFKESVDIGVALQTNLLRLSHYSMSLGSSRLKLWETFNSRTCWDWMCTGCVTFSPPSETTDEVSLSKALKRTPLHVFKKAPAAGQTAQNKMVPGLLLILMVILTAVCFWLGTVDCLTLLHLFI